MGDGSRGALYGAVPPSGSFVNLDKANEDKRGGMNFHAQSLGFLATPPFVMFAFMDITFAFLWGSHTPLALVFASACIAFGALFFFIGRNHVKGPIYMFLSVLSFLATANGIMAGLSVQARFYGPYWNYKDRPVYTDVLATDPAAARADGGIINFADNAIVDTLRSGHILSSRGKFFCVAPILDESQQTRAEYWAVGMDCCGGRIGFYCDDAQDTSAKTGAVVFNMDSPLINDPYSKWIEAVKQTGARDTIQIPKDPILVRWVKDSSEVTDGLWREGTLHILGGMLFYGVASALVAVALHAATSQRRG